MGYKESVWRGHQCEEVTHSLQTYIILGTVKIDVFFVSKNVYGSSIKGKFSPVDLIVVELFSRREYPYNRCSIQKWQLNKIFKSVLILLANIYHDNDDSFERVMAEWDI